jgi:hypothetical protein
MFQTKYDSSEYFDFKLVYDKVDERKLGDFIEVDINFNTSLVSSVGGTQPEDVVLSNITLNGLDNFFIPATVIDPDVQYVVDAGDKFQVWAVSGTTQDINYSIAHLTNMKKLNGGFYQGFFKIHGYPVEFFNHAISKGWTANLTLFHNPTTGSTTLNELYPDNAGFVFYIGTRAENKFNNITDVELSVLKNDYEIQFAPVQTTLYTHGGEFTLTGSTYTGKYNITEGQYWTGGEKTDDSQKLEKIYKYKDLLNNGFGIRIKPDGHLGYRSIVPKECEDEITNDWVDVYDACEDIWYRKLVTPYYKIIEQYSKTPVMLSKVNKWVNLTITFERYFSVKSKCQLKYSDFRKGVLKVFVNGIKVFTAKNVEEVFEKELDVQKELQEAVPYVISVGGGTQGLLEAVYLDPAKQINGVLEKYFAGTYMGSVSRFNFYSTPATVPMIRNKAVRVLSDLGIPITFGGRRIITY